MEDIPMTLDREAIPVELEEVYLGGIAVSGVRQVTDEQRAQWRGMARRRRRIGVVANFSPLILAAAFVSYTLAQGFGSSTGGGFSSAISLALMFAAIFSPFLVIAFGLTNMRTSRGLGQLVSDELLLQFETSQPRIDADDPLKKWDFGGESEMETELVHEVGWPSRRMVTGYGRFVAGADVAVLEAKPEVPSAALTSSLYARAISEDEYSQYRTLSKAEIGELKPIRWEVFKSIWKGSMVRLYALWFGLGSLFVPEAGGLLIGVPVLLFLFALFLHREFRALRFVYDVSRDIRTGRAVVCLDEEETPVEFLPFSGLMWTIEAEAAPWRFVPFALSGVRRQDGSDLA